MTTPQELITNAILSMVDSAGKWTPPWHQTELSSPSNALTKNRYHNSNILILWASAYNGRYTSSEWATYKQWNQLGKQIVKGSKGTPVIYYSSYKKTIEGVDDAVRIPIARTSFVFNACQTVGYEEPTHEQASTTNEPMPHIDLAIQQTGAKLEFSGDKAYYIPSADYICMPKIELFHTVQHYYSTTFHELVHWTGHKTRLDRELAPRFKQNAYAMEELVAELGAAFMSAEFGISNHVRNDHASYLKAWLEVLQQDKTAIVTASSVAGKAFNYLMSLINQNQIQEAA